MKTTVLSMVLAVLVAHLATCFAGEEWWGGGIIFFHKSWDPKKAAELESKYDEQGVRLYTIEAMGKRKDKEALPFLLYALDNEHPQVRLWAALALKELGEKERKLAVGPLVKKLGDTAEVDCYGWSKKAPNARRAVKLGVRRRVCVCDAAVEALNSIIPERKAERKFICIFYPSEEQKKSKSFQFYGANHSKKPDTGHWGNPENRKKAIEDLQEWWRENKEKPEFQGEIVWPKTRRTRARQESGKDEEKKPKKSPKPSGIRF